MAKVENNIKTRGERRTEWAVSSGECDVYTNSFSHSRARSLTRRTQQPRHTDTRVLFVDEDVGKRYDILWFVTCAFNPISLNEMCMSFNRWWYVTIEVVKMDFFYQRNKKKYSEAITTMENEIKKRVEKKGRMYVPSDPIHHRHSGLRWWLTNVEYRYMKRAYRFTYERQSGVWWINRNTFTLWRRWMKRKKRRESFTRTTEIRECGMDANIQQMRLPRTTFLVKLNDQITSYCQLLIRCRDDEWHIHPTVFYSNCKIGSGSIAIQQETHVGSVFHSVSQIWSSVIGYRWTG